MITKQRGPTREYEEGEMVSFGISITKSHLTKLRAAARRIKRDDGKGRLSKSKAIREAIDLAWDSKGRAK